MMPVDPIDFASLLCSRLCHDLLSPVGALNNGLELMAGEHDPEMRARCMSLLEQSAQASANKLKFFRLAFGAAGSFGEEVPTREAKSAIAGLINERTTLNWVATEATLPKPAIKTLLNLALVASDAMVRGGQLDIGAERRGNEVEIVVRASGDRIVLDPEIRRALEGGVTQSELSSRTAAVWMTHQLVHAGGGELLVDTSEGLLVLGALWRP